MKKFLVMAIGLGLVLGTTSFAQDKMDETSTKTTKKMKKTKKSKKMGTDTTSTDKKM